jgi:hypothetical protein
MPVDNSNISRREKEVRKVLADKSQARSNIWDKLDDSMLAVEALVEAIELLKENFLRFEGDPEPKQMSRSQGTIARGFDMEKRSAEAVLKQLKAMRGKAESTSSLVSKPAFLHQQISPSQPVQYAWTDVGDSMLDSQLSRASPSPTRAPATTESRQR